MKKQYLFIFPCLLLLGVAKAQWQPVNGPYIPGTMFINCLVASGTDIYAASLDNGNPSGIIGVIHSNDNGYTWTKTTFSQETMCLAMVGTKILAGSDSGLYYSSDHGNTWYKTPPLGVIHFESMAVYDTIIYGSVSFSGLYRSSNLGQNWTYSGLSGKDPSHIKILGTDIYVLTSSGIAVSSDLGHSWNFKPVYPDDLINDYSVTGTTLFIAGWHGVYVSINDGVTWTLTSLQIFTNCLFVQGSDLYAGTNSDGIFVSHDNGTHWFQCGLPWKSIYTITSNGANLLAGANDGLYVSTDQGSTWTREGVVKADVICMMHKGTGIFAGGRNKGLYSTRDYGVTWTDCALPYTVTALAVSGSNLFAGTYLYGIERSTDDGVDWEPVNTGLGNWSLSVKSLFVTNQNILAGTDDRIYMSNNEGATWNPAGTGMPESTSVRSIVTDSASLFAGTNHGMYISTDNATSWNLQNAGLTDTNVLTAVVSGSYVYAGTNGGGVFKSTNQGYDWTPVNTGLDNLYVNTLVLLGLDILAGTGQGIFLSRDGCAHWTNASIGLPDSAVNALFVSGEFLYAGVSNDGMWKRPLADFQGIDEKQDLISFELYPNPAVNRVYLNYHFASHGTGLTLSIFMSTGQEIRSYPLQGKEGSFSFDVSDLPSGLYLCKLHDDTFSGGMKKLIVMK